MRPSSRDEFAIAIICALPLEAEAVEDLFDETYDRLGEYYRKQPGDDNAVHIGTVASADTVMKSSEHRDRLVKSEGVIGFEMEGAGVWDNISCIIIKGVCDYADSHKNKAWQSYAAATGAAAAKAFLEYWESTAREEVDKFHIPLDLSAVPAIEEFIGREDELNHLRDYLKPGSSHTRRVAVLHGLGGIGKTQLAIHFARKHQNDFTAIFWLSGKDKSALILSLSSFLPQIQGQPVNNGGKDEEEAEQRAGQVLQWLSAPGNNRWLIIFDNVDQYAPLPDSSICGYDICEFFPKVDHGSIIITSRAQGVVEVGKPFPIGKLIQKDATRLLLQSSGFLTQEVTQVEIEQDILSLVNQLDGLSLAIVLAGAFMRETGTGIRDYLQFYRNSWPALQSQVVPTRHYQQGNILETWMITYQEIQKRDPTAATLLLLLGCFDNRDVWYELIQSGRNCSYTPPWFNIAVSNKLAFMAKIKMLIAFSLVEPKQHEGSYTIHPVVRDWCSYIAASEKRTVQLHELALVCVGCMVPRHSNRDYARLQQRLLPHANYLIRRERNNWPDDKIAVLRAFHGLGNLYANQGKLKEAEEMYQRALAGRERTLGPDHTLTLDTVNNLGNLYSDQGKLKAAEEMYQRALAGREKALGPDHTSTLETVNNLGLLYSDQGNLRKAEEMYQRALAGFEKALGPDHTSTLDTVHNLGILYKKQGNLRKPEEMYQRALAGYEKGPGQTSTLNTVHNLGILYKKQDKLKEAEQMYQRALAGYEKALEQMYQRALAGYEKALGPDHTSTLDTVNNLGTLYSDQVKLKEAEEMYWRALLKEAEQMYQRALAGYEKALGPDHTFTLDTVNNLGTLYFNEGKLKEAEQMYQRALAGREKALGPDHTFTLDTVHNLGILYKKQDKLKEAEQMYQRALAGFEKAWGSWTKPVEMYQRALAGYEKGPGHTSTRNTLYDLVILYEKQDKLKEAEQMYQRALAGYEKALGPGHSKTRMVSESLATLATFDSEHLRILSTLCDILRRK
ncbi:uncharacterized protein BDW70DRAFT_161387 [Aspergillus foveolatus]|uniref:uncharacterized protein n=1 Tax=Aspergillus foveolatus TaxID=210207 RepID=UPI003CCDE797